MSHKERRAVQLTELSVWKLVKGKNMALAGCLDVQLRRINGELLIVGLEIFETWI